MPAEMTLPVGHCDRHVRERFALCPFLHRLAAVNTRADVLAFLAGRPAAGDAARPLYDRLGVFLAVLDPPGGVWAAELDAYRAMVERLIDSGSMPYGEGARALVAIGIARDLTDPAPEGRDD